MDRIFERSELTEQILIGLGYAVSLLSDVDSDGRERLIANDFERLIRKIINEKLDVKLVSRDE